MAAATHRGACPEIGRREIMPIDSVLVHIVIALGIMALAARAIDSGK